MDLIYCPKEFKPDKWSDDPEKILPRHEIFNLAQYGIHYWRPILTHDDPEVDMEFEFLEAHRRRFLYVPENSFLFEIIDQNLGRRDNWKKLDLAVHDNFAAPDRAFGLARVDTTEHHGEPRIIEAPHGWTHNTYTPDRARNMPTQPGMEMSLLMPKLVVTTERGGNKILIVEQNTKIFLWYERNDYVRVIDEKGGLLDVLGKLHTKEALDLVLEGQMS